MQVRIESPKPKPCIKLDTNRELHYAELYKISVFFLTFVKLKVYNLSPMLLHTLNSLY